MSSEKFDNKIKDSLTQRNPDYKEQSWDKMEQLLDKHLPVKKDGRRRIFFILFLFLLMGGGSYLIFNNFSANNIPNTSKQNQPESIPVAASHENSKITTSDNNKVFLSEKTNASNNEVDVKQKFLNTFLINKKKEPAGSILISENKIETGDNKPITNSKNNSVDLENENNQLKKKELDENMIGKKNNETEQETKIIPEQSTDVTLTENLPVKNKGSEKIKEEQKKEKAGKKGILSNFAITLSTGPELSKVGSNNNGSIKLNYGLGLRYQVSKRIGIRTGFYSTHKVYQASTSDYNPPAIFWNYYPNLKEINADCLVYDIPINIDYYFSQNKQRGFFASAGLSTLIMKREEYNYLIKPPYSPQYVSYKRIHENENKHYFSTLNLSAGYSRKLNNRISIQVEPYLKIALSGVGYGKVNLNSTGLLFSAIIKPFGNKDNQKK